MSALPLACCFVAGALLYRRLGSTGWSRGDRLRWAIAWGPAFAFGILSYAFFAARWCGLDGPLPWSLAALGMAIAFLRGTGGTPREDPVEASARAMATPGGPVAVRIATAVLLAATAWLLLGTFRIWQQSQPAGMWDAVAIWNAGARFLARAEAKQLPQIFGALTEGHGNYPLFLGAAVAAQWELAGEDSNAVPLAMSLAFTVGLAAALHLLVRSCGAPRFAGPAVLLVFSTPAVWKWSFAQVADVPLAYLALAAALPLVARLQGDASSAPPPALSGFVFGLLPWIKDEGAVVAVALAGGYLGLAWKRDQLRPFRLRKAAPFLLATLPGVAALALFKFTWAPAVPQRASFLRGAASWAQLLDLDRWRLVATETLHAFDPRTGAPLWGCAWPFLGLGLLFWGFRLNSRTAPGAALLASTSAVLCAAYACAFVLSPFDLAWHVGSALDRLLLHVLPLLAAAVFGLAGSEPPAAGRDAPSP